MSLSILGTVLPKTGLPVRRAGFFINAATTTALVPAVATQRIALFGLWVFNGTVANTLTFQDGAGTNLIAAGATIALPSNFIIVLDLRGDEWFDLTGLGQSLQVVTSGTGPLVGHVYYTQG